jgi:hypothetical protein
MCRLHVADLRIAVIQAPEPEPRIMRYELTDFEWTCRRVATRYDKLAANYLAFVKLASIRIWLRAYVHALVFRWFGKPFCSSCDSLLVTLQSQGFIGDIADDAPISGDINAKDVEALIPCRGGLSG